MSAWRGVIEEARRNARGLVGGAVGIALGIGAVVFFGGLGLGVKEGVLGRALSRLPVGTIEVRPRGGLPVGFIRFEGADLLIRTMDDAALEQLRAVEGVENVHGRVAAMFPMRAQGGRSLLGRDVYTDVFASGVDAAFLAPDLPAGTKFVDAPDGPVPAVISTQLIELFNRAVAPSLGIPGLDERTIVGFAFTLVLGESFSSGRNKGGRAVTVEVVGVSDRAMLLGITVPRATVERWNREWAADQPKGYASAYIVTRDGAALGSVVKVAEAMGFTVEQSAKVAGTLVSALVLTWMVVAGLILLVAGFNVAQTLQARVHARRRELGLLRALGARRSHVRNLVLGEAALMACAAAVLGTGGGVVGGFVVDHMVRRYLPRFPFQPDSLFMFPWWLLGGAVVIAVACALCGAVLPAHRAATLDPARALEE